MTFDTSHFYTKLHIVKFSFLLYVLFSMMTMCMWYLRYNDLLYSTYYVLSIQLIMYSLKFKLNIFCSVNRFHLFGLCKLYCYNIVYFKILKISGRTFYMSHSFKIKLYCREYFLEKETGRKMGSEGSHQGSLSVWTKCNLIKDETLAYKS